MAMVRICDKIGCSNETSVQNFRVSKSIYLNPVLYDSQVFDLCDTCMFEIFGWVKDDS